jgi:L-Ala-D/L-Glu epimerase
MKIIHTDIYKFSIPMIPFTISTGTMHFAQNLFIRVHTDEGIHGVGECSAFPMITGETQATCFAMAKDFAGLWKGRDPLDIGTRMQELHAFASANNTVKSAFDMALYDISAKKANMPLYRFLGAPDPRPLETDLTIGIYEPEAMAAKAVEFKNKGVRIIKVKLGRDGREDVERVRQIRDAAGADIRLRIDANQGWDFDTAAFVLQQVAHFQVDFCEQPMRRHDDNRLPALREISPVKIMADESVFDHHDAARLIRSDSCDYVNIKFAKSGGILEAGRIDEVCSQNHIPCMMGGMLESRIALSAFAHFAIAHENIVFYDLDTALLGHTVDPVAGGVRYNGFFLDTPDKPGVGADADDDFLKHCEHLII